MICKLDLDVQTPHLWRVIAQKAGVRQEYVAPWRKATMIVQFLS